MSVKEDTVVKFGKFRTRQFLKRVDEDEPAEDDGNRSVGKGNLINLLLMTLINPLPRPSCGWRRRHCALCKGKPLLQSIRNASPLNRKEMRKGNTFYWLLYFF